MALRAAVVFGSLLAAAPVLAEPMNADAARRFVAGKLFSFNCFEGSTGTGRIFVTKNANAAAGAVTYQRIDNLPGATADPNRFPSSIYIDPTNPNHAWISYSGYNINTPTLPGHVFEVTWNQAAGTATWTNLDGGTGPMGDLPTTDLVRDDATGDLYASTDFGVMMLAGGNGAGSWVAAGEGLPNVEVAGLTIVPGARKLYAASRSDTSMPLASAPGAMSRARS